ncbi:WSC domain-containing protein 1-like isoform X2 [Portunus trituberculatus]|uniref:WSC domain-containing protein 1-like isoform X2 n=1 Tax=Portunus trituberculatus TaxID=210409 RepID=UPI001E1CBC5D|nr:WSC domain-containing protein 1-like isoform X2 [Portunus trituberculatus]
MSFIKGKVFGLRNLMTFVVYGLLILLFSLTMVHWHSHIQPQFSTLSLRILDETGGFLSVLHRSVKRKLISGALPLSTSIKSEWKLWGNDSQESPCSSYTTSLIKKGFLGEGRPLSETLVSKTHKNVRLSFNYHASSIRHPTLLLIRNPANALISFYKFSKSHSHVDQISYELFSSENFHKFVKTNLVKWMTLAVTSLTMNDAPLYVLYYERLLENPIEELTKVLAFLGVPIDEGRMACIASHLEGSFKRNGSKKINPYTAEEKISLIEAANAVNRTVQAMGYLPLPTYD